MSLLFQSRIISRLVLSRKQTKIIAPLSQSMQMSTDALLIGFMCMASETQTLQVYPLRKMWCLSLKN